MGNRWWIELETPDGGKAEMMELTPCGTGCKVAKDGFIVEMESEDKGIYRAVTVFVRATEGERDCFVSLKCRYDAGELYTFSGPKSGEETFRQSPHDPDDHVLDMAKEAVPMVALRDGGSYIVALCDQPGHCDNYTTQYINSDLKEFRISSGDNGRMPGYQGKEFAPFYHRVSNTKEHVFRLAIFRSEAADQNALRRDVFCCIDAVWGRGGSKYHAVCFSSNYMHYRKNETGYSNFWVTPGIEYANKQYTRDAFWQSMVLPLAMEQQCYDAVYRQRYQYAECGMIFLIWSYRLQKRGGEPDAKRMADALSYVEDHVKNGCYMAGSDADGRKNFKSWYDLVAFDDDDMIAYNQGLLVTALKAANALGLKPKTKVGEAVEAFLGLYTGSYFPLSRKKHCLCVDAFVGDLLSMLLFGESFVPDEMVHTCYRTVTANAKTPYGIKVTAAEDGSFLPLAMYGTKSFVDPEFVSHSPGYYQWGGSWYIYEMLFHIAAYLHDTESAEDNLIERAGLDFKIGGTYYEFVDTVTGKGYKANQGWNAAIYPIWEQIVEEGKATGRFFEEMERIL